jgi:hypothetical protein
MRSLIRPVPIVAALLVLGVGISVPVFRKPSKDNPVDPFYDEAGASRLTAEQWEKANFEGSPLPHAGLATLGPPIGQTAPEIEGKDYHGKFFKLSDYRGKIVVLDCWVDY